MHTIERDTHSRGTPDRPQYVFFARYGRMPPVEVWLDAASDSEAVSAFHKRFPGLAPDEVHVNH
jgi:hypothetical protein